MSDGIASAKGHERGAPSGQGAALVAASFNLRRGYAWDSRHSWPLRRGAAAQSIDRLGAEVVGLQEVHGFQQRCRTLGAQGCLRTTGR